MADDLLFAYGTLMPGCAPAHLHRVCAGMEVIGPGTVRGILYDLEQFPGVVEGDGVVYGVVLRVPEGAWVQLDEYEGCPAPGCPKGLFSRISTRARLDDGREVECWLYVYAQDVRGKRPVASGRWEQRHQID